jgi:hypothetical protein
MQKFEGGCGKVTKSLLEDIIALEVLGPARKLSF